MSKQPPIRVALDLETTGLHAEQDAILEVAAVKFQGGTILDTMETLVAPGRPIPFRVQRLTGITPQQVADAPGFESIARRLQQFIGDHPIVGHSIPFDAGFLRRRGLVRNNPLIDTFELATVLLPSLPSYNLGQVAQALGVPLVPGRHRAMVDTILAMKVFLALDKLLKQVDIGLLNDLANLDAPRSWPLLGFFRQEWRERMAADGMQNVPLRGNLRDRFAAQLGMDPRVLSFAIARGEPSAAENIAPEAQPAVSSSTVAEQQRKSAPATEHITAVPVEQQASYQGHQAAYRAVLRALEEKSSLLLELTIGGNDFTPALLPALQWVCQQSASGADSAASNEARRLVIACANTQAARRLIDNVLPRLSGQLAKPVKMAYLAERGGYLCIHRWFGSALRRTSGELSAEQARGLAKLALWAQETLTGERSELTILPQEMTAWERICSGVERVSLALADGRGDSPYQRCLYRSKGYCFVRRAEERVNVADVVVTTHAGLLDDLSSEKSLLRDVDCRLILDADLLDEESAHWNNQELDHQSLLRQLNTIGIELPDGRYQGLLALAAPALRENGPGGLSTTHTIAKAELDSRMLGWFQTLRQARAAIDTLFVALAQLIQEVSSAGNSGGPSNKGKAARMDNASRSANPRVVERVDQPLRLTSQVRNVAGWMEVEHAWQQAAYRLQMVIDLAHEAEKIMLTRQRPRHRLDPGGGEDDSVAWEFAAIAERLLAQKRFGQQAFSLSENGSGGGNPVNREEAMVYWLRVPPAPLPFAQQRAGDTVSAGSSSPNALSPAVQVENLPVLYGQLVQASTLLKRYILTPGSAVIFAGAALSIDNNFSYCRGRFGLDADASPALSVVTEHREQTLLFVPNDVPEPNMPQYQRHLDEAIAQLAIMLDGQLVVLFTSYAALRSSYAAVKPLLEARGILVLGHGIDGSPRQLWQLFSDQERVVLLGAGSFWDGIEEVSRPPACVLISRLPMPVLNDPPLAAIAEQYSDQLHQVTIPIATLRTRRALNRLAWSGNRRNAVVLFDRRVISKEYGATILNTLPHCSQRQGQVSHMPEIILDWLTATGSWE
ncbi:MAG TPA: exonuclease domain-containing protein [Ktedonobacteraceae bacterium]|jgi:ATP-dependent DNA helicase DinG|nr:exonuclease domain-containing protein [Ktedonobacteraceae bacterium]